MPRSMTFKSFYLLYLRLVGLDGKYTEETPVLPIIYAHILVMLQTTEGRNYVLEVSVPPVFFIMLNIKHSECVSGLYE